MLDTAGVARKCRCGVNVKERTFKACNGSGHSRCKCFGAKQKCTSLCDCKGCDNPHGVKVVLGKRKRERQPHLWQTFDFSNDSVLLSQRGKVEDGC